MSTVRHRGDVLYCKCIRKRVRRRGAREEEWTGGVTTPHPSMLRLIRIAVLADFALQAIVECRAG